MALLRLHGALLWVCTWVNIDDHIDGDGMISPACSGVVATRFTAVYHILMRHVTHMYESCSTFA